MNLKSLLYFSPLTCKMSFWFCSSFYQKHQHVKYHRIIETKSINLSSKVRKKITVIVLKKSCFLHDFFSLQWLIFPYQLTLLFQRSVSRRKFLIPRKLCGLFLMDSMSLSDWWMRMMMMMIANSYGARCWAKCFSHLYPICSSWQPCYIGGIITSTLQMQKLSIMTRHLG